jgi:hypothetical protein
MRIGQRIRISYGEEFHYGIIKGISEDRWSKDEWVIKFTQGFIATRNKNYCFKINKLEELLYF